MMTAGNARSATLTVLLGDATALMLVHRVLARRAVQESSGAVILDCGGVFDPYAIALEARRAGARPETALNALLVCRTFTGYQELHALRKLARFARGQQIYVLNPLHVLLDEDLPRQDRPWLFRHVLIGLEWLSDHGHAVRVCQQSVRGSALPEAPRFEAALKGRYPLILATEGRFQVMNNGKVGIPLQPRDRPRRVDVRPLPTWAA